MTNLDIGDTKIDLFASLSKWFQSNLYTRERSSCHSYDIGLNGGPRSNISLMPFFSYRLVCDFLNINKWKLCSFFVFMLFFQFGRYAMYMTWLNVEPTCIY